MLWTCRFLLAAVAVSYLMCVLLLSGIQKEDIDSSVLNKLQRYNVNIDDLNNHDLLQECTTTKSMNNKNTTPLKYDIDENRKQENISLEKIERNKDVIYNVPHINTEGNNSDKNNIAKVKINHVIQYKDGQPEIKSILNFWNDMKDDSSIKHSSKTIKKFNISNEITNENDRTEQKNKRNIADALNSNESDTIQRMLLNFILKKGNKQVNEVESKKGINIDDSYRDFHRLNKENTLINREDNVEYKSVKFYPVNFEATHMKQYSTNSEPMNNRIQQKPERETYKSINANNFNEIINALQSFKINYPIKTIDFKKREYFDGNDKERLRSSESLFFDEHTQNKNFFTTEIVITPKTTEQTLSRNVIKEIANSVKELVMRDLRREIFRTTSTITTTTVTEETTITTNRGETTKLKKENQIAGQSILNKFMDLFEELKSLNLKSSVISSKVEKDAVTREAPTYPAARLTAYNDMDQPNYYMPKAYPKNPQNTFDFFPQEHKFRSNIVSEPVLRTPVKAIPITVQTNNMEIPPLGIPVDTPENPISQNIIVSTTYPQLIAKKLYSKIKVNSRIEDLFPKLPQDRFVQPRAPIAYMNQNYNKHLLNKEHSNYDTSYNERITSPVHKEHAHRDDEFKHSDVTRFHEQLERGVDYEGPRNEHKNRVDCCDKRFAYSKQMVECCQRKIASREQASLHGVKKQRSYDDTHFKNFLKSQQKVTDMLEMILASRSRARSVEIA